MAADRNELQRLASIAVDKLADANSAVYRMEQAIYPQAVGEAEERDMLRHLSVRIENVLGAICEKYDVEP